MNSAQDLEGDGFLQTFSFELPPIALQPSVLKNTSTQPVAVPSTTSRGLDTAQPLDGPLHPSTVDPLDLSGEYPFTLGEVEGVFDGNYVNTAQLHSASSPPSQAKAAKQAKESKGRKAKAKRKTGINTPAPFPQMKKKRRLTNEEIGLIVNVYQRTLAEVKSEQKEKGKVTVAQAAPGTRPLSSSEVAADRTGQLCCVGRNRVLALVKQWKEGGNVAPAPQPENRGKNASPHRVFTDSDIQAIRAHITQRAAAGEQTTTPHLIAWLAASRGKEVHPRRIRYYMPLIGLQWDKEKKSLVVGEIEAPPADSYFSKAPHA